MAYFLLHEGASQAAGSDKDARWMALLSERGRENAWRLIAQWKGMIANRLAQIVWQPLLW